MGFDVKGLVSSLAVIVFCAIFALIYFCIRKLCRCKSTSSPSSSKSKRNPTQYCSVLESNNQAEYDYVSYQPSSLPQPNMNFEQSYGPQYTPYEVEQYNLLEKSRL